MNGEIDTKNTIYWKDRKRTLFGLPLSFTKYELKGDRLFINTGCFNLTEDEIRLYRILDITLTRSFGQRIFGVGTIHVTSSDKSLGNFDIVSVKKPREVKELLSDLVEKQRDEKRVVNREFMGTSDVDDDDNIN